MSRKHGLAKTMSEKMPCFKGKKIPICLCEVIIDIVFDSIKELLIEDGEVNIKNQFCFKAIDVREHKKRMPDGKYVVIPATSKVRVAIKEKFKHDIANEKRKRKMLNDIKNCHDGIEKGVYTFSNKELVEIQTYLDKLGTVMTAK